MLEPRTTFLNEFGDSTLRVLVAAILDASNEAERHCQTDYSEPMGQQFLPHDRFARIADRLMQVAATLPNISATFRFNAARNHRHVVLSTAHTIVTVHGVTEPSDRVREAVYRSQYADWSQPRLFSLDDRLPVDTIRDSRVYAQIVHSHDPNSLIYPGYLTVRFPSPNGEDLAPPIDLLQRFADLLPTPYLVPAAIVERPVLGGLRARQEVDSQ